ncbi:MAG: 4Fe-4S binding protein, partial [Anaerolineaceae bacterium]|nr:4Fe-4S binding protein [Anaerolineaceae bacterium]
MFLCKKRLNWDCCDPYYNMDMNPPVPPIFESDSPYRHLAAALDALPNRFPPAEDGSDLRLLAKIFTPEEAALAANLMPEMEPPAQISTRLGRDMRELSGMLKEMSKKGLISVGKTSEGRLGFGLMPFVVGIYEAQIDRIDAELAKLFEDYYQKSFATSLRVTPQVHRVIPVRVAVKNDTEVAPFESVSALVDRMQSWGVIDCICRTQKALIGDPCQHPVDVCMVLSEKPDAFSSDGTVTPLDRQGALNTLQRAADAGLVHCVSNNQQEMWYICNCCTCSCGILRGIAELGIANAVARSAFTNQVDEALCVACDACVEYCQFGALSLLGVAQVDSMRCVGCGVCVPACP